MKMLAKPVKAAHDAAPEPGTGKNAAVFEKRNKNKFPAGVCLRVLRTVEGVGVLMICSPH
jgi:hypothetical protein